MTRRRFGDVGFDPAKLQSPAFVRSRERRLVSAGVTRDGARDALAAFDRGAHVFAVNRGQWSMIDVIEVLLERTGPADLSVWSWVVAGHEVEAVSALLNQGAIRRFRMTIDWAGAQRDMPYIAELQEKYGNDCVRVTKTHAKVATIATDDGWRIVARGSMNLNANPRFEQLDVSDDPQIFDVIRGLEDELWSRGKPLPVRELEHHDAAALLEGGADAMPGWAKPSSKPWF